MSIVALRYLLSFSLYIFAYISFSSSGIWTFTLVFYVYFFVPLLELISKPNYSNTSINNEKNKINKKIYDYIIFLVFPFQYYFLFYFLHTFSIDLTTTEKIGRIISMGALCAHTINVAHELGHRFNKFDQLLSKLLLLSTLNTHFFIEHNRGHHKKVATLEDPATARKNENVYIFIIRSMVFGYISAWNLEITRLKNNGTANYFFNFRNQMTRFTLLQLTLLSVIYLIFGINVLIAFLIVSFSINIF